MVPGRSAHRRSAVVMTRRFAMTLIGLESAYQKPNRSNYHVIRGIVEDGKMFQ